MIDGQRRADKTAAICRVFVKESNARRKKNNIPEQVSDEVQAIPMGAASDYVEDKGPPFARFEATTESGT